MISLKLRRSLRGRRKEEEERKEFQTFSCSSRFDLRRREKNAGSAGGAWGIDEWHCH